MGTLAVAGGRARGTGREYASASSHVRGDAGSGNGPLFLPPPERGPGRQNRRAVSTFPVPGRAERRAITMAELTVGTARRNITAGRREHGRIRRPRPRRGGSSTNCGCALPLRRHKLRRLLCRDLIDTERRWTCWRRSRAAPRPGARPALHRQHAHAFRPSTSYDDADNRVYVGAGRDLRCRGGAANARPATLSVAQRPVQRDEPPRTARRKIVLGVNPDGPVDTVVDVLSFADAAGGAPLATIFAGVHGVVMGPELPALRRRPGAAEAFVERTRWRRGLPRGLLRHQPTRA